MYCKEETKNEAYKSDHKGIIERRMLWESIFAGSAGAGLFWDNEGWIWKYDLWHLYKPATTFVHFADIPDNRYEPVTSSNDIEDVRCYAMRAYDCSVGYLFHKDRLENDLSGYIDLTGKFYLNVKKHGTYTVSWFDINTADVIRGTSIQSVTKEEQVVLELNVPVFKRDIAVYVKYQN